MWQLVSGLALGWSLGANDAGNIFGTAVASRMVRFSTAAVICAAFVVLGAVADGAAGMHTYQGLSSGTLTSAFVASLMAALTVTLMTALRFPVSTSQAVVGALMAIGASTGTLDLSVLGKVVACWVGTPIGALLAALALYYPLGWLLNRLDWDLFRWDRNLRWALIAAGAYGSYALGANNVANVTGPFVGPELSIERACLLGGLAIALGVVTFSRGVMMTVGAGVVRLNGFTALVVVLAQAITVHVYALIGVPVSTSQAVVGAVLGIGLIKGVHTVNWRLLRNIGLAWLSTPLVACAATLAALWLLRQLTAY